MNTNKQDKELIQEVMQAERQWVEAHRRLDIAALDRLLADDYKHIRADGAVIGKAEDLASYQTGDRHWELAESDEYDIQLHGQTAILIGRWRARALMPGNDLITRPALFQSTSNATAAGRWLRPSRRLYQAQRVGGQRRSSYE